MRATVGDDADSFDSVKTTVGGADVAGDGASGGDVGLFEVDVVGDEEAARSYGTGPGGLVKFGASDIRAAGCVAAGGVAQSFELAAAYVFELNAIWAGGGGSVEVDGDAVAAPDEEAGLTGEHGALGRKPAEARFVDEEALQALLVAYHFVGTELSPKQLEDVSHNIRR